MKCKICQREMDLDEENVNYGTMAQYNFYVCACGAEVKVYEADRESEWRTDESVYIEKEVGNEEKR